MFDATSPLGRLLNTPMRPGRVTWIGVRPARHAPLTKVAEASADPTGGLSGDRYGTAGGKRQVTLIGQEDLDAIASYLGMAAVAPGLLRRNLVVTGLNLMALKGRHLLVGTVVLEVTGECHPCSRMEAALGEGGYNAVRGHGGVTARVVTAGVVGLGDAIRRAM